jgi:hypothetical protein
MGGKIHALLLRSFHRNAAACPPQP